MGSSNYIVPNGVKKVGDYAFTGCNQLESITFSDDVIMVGKYAFFYSIYNHRTTKTNQKYPSVNL